MNYQIKFMFTDGKDIRVEITHDRIERFFDALNQGRIYWLDDDLESGFWLPVEKIRYIRLKKAEDEQNQESKGKISKIADLARGEAEPDYD